MMPNRQVSFSETSEMVLVTNLSESAEKHNLWFTSDELDGFKSSMSRNVKMVRLHISKQHAPSASSILGLEKFLTVQLTEEYKVRRKTVAKEVMDEVRYQGMMGRIPTPADVDRLARVSADCTKWARERARAAALFLEQDQENECEEESQASTESCQEQCTFSADAPVRRQLSRRSSLQETKRNRTTAPVMSPMPSDGYKRFIRTVSPV